MTKQIKKPTPAEEKVKEAKLILANIAMDGRGYEQWSPKLRDAVKKFILNGY